MQIIISDPVKSEVTSFTLSRLHLTLAVAGIIALFLFLVAVFSWITVHLAVRDRWPVVSNVVRTLVYKEMEQRDAYVRENIDVMAGRLGELQAQLLTLDSLGERVGQLTGVKYKLPDAATSPTELDSKGAKPKVKSNANAGGIYYPLENLSLNDLNNAFDFLQTRAQSIEEYFSLVESNLLVKRIEKLMEPRVLPVDANYGSGYGWRKDPFTGGSALHTGLDFPATQGTPVKAAAGGIVIKSGWVDEYGSTVEISHGNEIITRYAHGSKLLVKEGDLVKSGEPIMLVGSSGRSTGPHLHFEVMVNGHYQNPYPFLKESINDFLAKK